MFHLNIASLGLHKEELVTSLSLLDFDFDVIAVTETKIRKGKKPIFNPELPGYKHYQTPSECDKGGTLIYFKDHFKHKRRKDLEEKMYKACELESVFVEIINEGKKNTIYGCIYRHPSMDIQEFNKNYFENFLRNLSTENKTIYLLGDFNIDLLEIDSDENIANYYNTLISNLFIPHITLPTRITPRSKTLIDNIFSNDPNFTQGVSGNFTFSISDHLPQFLLMPREDYRPPKRHVLYKRDLKNFNKEELVADVININWPEVLYPGKMDPNYSFDMFDKQITDIINKHAPLKKLNKKDFKLQAKPWITPGIIKSIRRRDKLLRLYIKTEGNRKEEIHIEYKIIRNKIIDLIRKSKKNHFKNLFIENANNAKKTWASIRSIINIRSLNKGQPTSILLDENLETDPTLIGESFNTYFTTIAEKLQKNISIGDNNFAKYLNTPLDYNFLFRSADSTEIIMIINSLQSGKASGPYSIPTEILQTIKQNICYPLKEIINMSFATGVYPDKLKIAKVIPIYKNKGDQLLVSNYRPISLLSNINKIFEKLVYSRLYSFFNLHQCIFELQFGFRANHSTNHALFSLTEEIRKALDNSNFACGIFIDLQKAFDTVDHQILLSKLEHYGIRGIANGWFKSYLSNRQQFVSINGFDSKKQKMKLGVPQGSVLGPLLFLIYINDLHHALKFSTIHHFADDTNLLIADKTIKKIQKKINIDLKLLCKWLKANKISLNASKTELIIFRDPKKKINFDPKIMIDGKKLIPCKFVKYLGIIIDEHLNWHAHATALSSRLSRAIGMLSKIRHYVTFETLRMIYYGIFSSILMYNCQIWGQSSGIVNKLQILQNKALRVINFKPYRSSSTILFKNNEILKIADTVSLQNFLFAHDSLCNNLPSPLCGLLHLKETNHNLRYEDFCQLVKPFSRTITYGSQSIKSKSVDIWNFINLKNCRSTNYIKLYDKSRAVSKKIVKKILLDQY